MQNNNRFLSLVFFLSTVIVGLFFYQGSSSKEEEARELFVNAYQNIQIFNASNDSELKLKAIKAALEDVNTIISKYPSSLIAVDLISKNKKIGEFDINSLKTAYEDLDFKNKIETSPFFLALLLIANHEEPTGNLLLKAFDTNKDFVDSSTLKYVLNQVENKVSGITDKFERSNLAFELATRYATWETVENSWRILEKYHYNHECCVGVIVKALMKDNNISDAKRLVEWIQSPYQKSNALTIIIDRIATTESKISEDLYNQLTKLEVKNNEVQVHKGHIALSLAALGKYDDALKLLEEIEDISHRVRMLNDITGIALGKGNIEVGNNNIQTINLLINSLPEEKSNDLKIDLVKTVINRHIIEKADKLIEDLITAPHDKAYLFTLIARHYLENNKPEMAIDYVEKIEPQILKIDPSTKYYFWRSLELSKILLELQYPEKGEKYLDLSIKQLDIFYQTPEVLKENLLDYSLSTDRLNLILGQFKKQDKALNVINRISLDWVKAGNLLSLSKGLAEAGLYKDAIYYARKTKNTEKLIEGLLVVNSEMAKKHMSISTELKEELKDILNEHNVEY